MDAELKPELGHRYNCKNLSALPSLAVSLRFTITTLLCGKLFVVDDSHKLLL